RSAAAVVAASTVAALVAAGCTAPGTPASDPRLDARVAEMMNASFRDQGIATVERLRQDEADALCSKAEGAPLPEAVAKRVEAEQAKTVRPPSDGRYLGDWKRGEALAQSGRGMTWTDASAAPQANGGNCYNCHQLSAAEISYGTLGPSLNRYGRLRGVADPASAAARPIVEYTWGKLWNARAYNACSQMPRFGHAGLLDESQIRDLMALLLDPASPVNRD
ncbi:MAG: sulfur oxidation c-type cytochrome SoxX, partial [Burkholderiales bacterium]